MKQVKSKFTGDIGELDFDSKEGVFIVVCYDLNTKQTVKNYYKSLEDLCEEWEDYEEPKKYWYIDERLRIWSTVRKEDDEDETHFINMLKSVGNYFETKEEAERAVEKLKAWKRLKDNGFKFTSWGNGILLQKTIAGQFRYEFPRDKMDDIEKDLDLLFNSEDD